MEYERLGSQGPNLSVVGYGAWEAGGEHWGPAVSDDAVIAAMHAGFDAGIDWVDTAEIYGAGRSEEVVGRALAGRNDIMVLTKVAPAPRGTGFRIAEVRRAAEASLARLGRDVIDVYQLHWPDPSVPVEETWEAMGHLVDDGLVRFVGVSNFSIDLVERCERIRHVDSNQVQLSILWRERRPQLVSCRSNGTGIIAYGPLAYGLLTGAISRSTTFPEGDWRGGGHGIRAYDQLFAPEVFGRNVGMVDRLTPIADRLDVSLAQLAIAWVIHQEGATAAIAGSRSHSHVVENAHAAEVRLSDADLSEIEVVIADSR